MRRQAGGGSEGRGVRRRVQCGAVRCGAARCVEVRCGAVQCGVVRCGAVRCGAMRCGAVRCNAVRCSAVRVCVWGEKKMFCFVSVLLAASVKRVCGIFLFDSFLF